MAQNPRIKALVLGVMLAIGASQSFAQGTTSSAVNGRVTDSEGRPVAGAVVEIIHTPSGTRKSVVTDSEGRYNTTGLRVGGPFVVEVTKDGYAGTRQEDVTLKLGEASAINVSLDPASQSLAAIEVVGAQQSIFDANNMGTTTNVNREAIESFPSISRSLEDYVRLDPRITQIDKERGGISVAGQNNRYNSLNIDGVPTNDPFGLNDNGFASLNQPISLDTIEEISISVSNYDVGQSDFVGANINAITKSGTNEFHGSAYAIYRNNNMVGENDAGEDFTGFDNEKTYGFTLGGPIIQDTLFFFLSYEKFESDLGGLSVGLAGSGATNELNITQADVDRVVEIANRVYGYDPGTFNVNNTNEDDKLLAKIDWNINDDHRLSVRYNRTTGEVLRTPDLDNNDYSLSSQWYIDDRTTEAGVMSLFSDWNSSFSTEFAVSQSTYKSNSNQFDRAPDVAIRVTNGEDINIGTDQFRHANRIDTTTTTSFFAGNYFLGDHTIKFGFDYKKDDIFNLFLDSYYGQYTYGSINDFEAGRFSFYRLRLPRQSDDVNTAAAKLELSNYGYFLQDTWFATPNLTLIYGLRADLPKVGGRPAYNEVIQPRFGFNYTFNSDRPTQLRGGFGLFNGSTANVWLANPFTNNGQLINVFEQRNGTTGTTFDPDNPLIPTGTNAIFDVDVVDPSFEQPAIWRGNLAFDHELPWWGLVASAEAIITRNENAIYYQHLNLGAPNGVLPDGRVHYWSTASSSGFADPNRPGARFRTNSDRSFSEVVLLSNTDKGGTENLTLSIEKPMADDNWSAKLSYTYGNAEEVNPGTSSRAISNFRNNAIFNPNEEEATTANYEIKDRFLFTTSYKHNFAEGYATTFSAFWEARSGRPFSYTFNRDANGDNVFGNDLFFVPERGQVAFTSGTSQNAIDGFFSYIQSNSYLNSREGRVTERNASTSPWVNQIDVRISQELPGFAKGHKGEVYLDILNIGNLLNDDWGQIDEAEFPYQREVAQFAGVNSAGQYVYALPVDSNGNYNPEGYIRRDVKGESRWAAQIGIRYTF